MSSFDGLSVGSSVGSSVEPSAVGTDLSAVGADANARSRPWAGRAVVHLDLDAFFASVAQLDNPELRGKPVIVGGDHTRRGVVSTCSYEARAFGVRSAMPAGQARRLCPDAVWVPSDFKRYRELSGRVFAILRDITPAVRPVSIDEAFADITPDARDGRHPLVVSREILARVSELGITGSIGLASSMTLAKIGSDFQKPRGLTVVWPGTEAAFLRDMPVRTMSGIGPRAEEHLREVGVTTLGELAALDRSVAAHIFGKTTKVLLARAAGIDPRPVVCDEPVKSVSNEYTFETDIHSAEEVRDALRDIASQVGRRLRKKGLHGRCVTLKLRFGDFTTKTVSRTLGVAVDNERILAPLAFELAQSIWLEGMGVRLLGIGVSHFCEDRGQLSLFGTDELTRGNGTDGACSGGGDGNGAAATHTAQATGALRAGAREQLDAREEQLTERLDRIKDRFGERAVLSGRQLKQQSDTDASWHLREETAGHNAHD